MDTILVVIEQREGKLNRVSWETITGAQQMASQTGWTVEAAVLGHNIAPLAAEVAAKQIAKVYAVNGESLAHYTSDGFTAALRALIESRKPRIVLLPHTYQVRDFAPKLATALQSTLVPDCIGFKYEGGRLLLVRQMFQGKFAADVALSGSGPWVASFQAGAYRVEQAQDGASPAPVENIAVVAVAARTRPEEPFKEAKQAVDLSQAEVIVAVGRGIKEQKNLEMAQKLAEILGGELAASRPICDNGWLPTERQVGSSGQTVAPKLYVALGISGAIQHVVGMKGARHVVSINKDSEAPIFEVSDTGIVGNLFDIVPPLIEELKKAKG